MKNLLIAGFVLTACAILSYWFLGREQRVKKIILLSESLKDNQLGENYKRSIYVYLPPGYGKTSKKYPCLYYLHGITSSNDEYFNLDFEKLLDDAIKNKVLPECLVVFPNSETKFKGSFYTNSEVSGHWADYISQDVVTYVDAHFQTIPKPESRGICGHSMGGNGALKIAMAHPEIFGSVYALSPSVLGWAEEFTTDNPSFKHLSEALTPDDVFSDFYASVFMAMARSYSANKNKKPFQVDLPVVYRDGIKHIDSAILGKWSSELPLNRIQAYKDSLRELKGIGLEYGTKDEFAHIPVSCRQFKSRLDSLGIECQLKVFDGRHYDKMAGKSGRLYTEMFPFFKRHLRE